MYLVKQLFFKHFYSVPINQRLYELQMAKMFAQICFYLLYLLDLTIYGVRCVPNIAVIQSLTIPWML